MDFKGLKDQLGDKAKDELLQKVDEIKSDIINKFEPAGSDKNSAADSGPTVGSVAHIEQPEEETENATAESDTEIEGNDVESTEDVDKEDEEAA